MDDVNDFGDDYDDGIMDEAMEQDNTEIVVDEGRSLSLFGLLCRFYLPF